MRWIGWSGFGFLVLALAGTVYAAGAGLFWPCEALNGQSQCTRVLTLSEETIDAMALSPDGDIIAVLRGAGPDPDQPVMLARIDPLSGAVRSRFPITALAPSAAVSRLAINADETRLALSVLDQATLVIDQAAGPVASVPQSLPAFMGFDAGNRLLMRRLGDERGIATDDAILAYDLSAPDAEPEMVTRAVAPEIFRSGLNIAFSPDGTLVAQNIPGARNGVGGLRLVPVDRPDLSGRLLGARLPPRCTSNLVHISFSPDGAHVAAAFDCIHAFGQEGSKLMVWDVDNGLVVADIAGRDWWGEFIWLDAATIAVERYDGDSRVAELFRITLDQ